MMMMNFENKRKERGKRKKKEQSRAEQVAESFFHLERWNHLFSST